MTPEQKVARRKEIERIVKALEAEADMLNHRIAELYDEDQRLWIELQDALVK